ncbi:MAG: PTS transporter subunit EIIA [Lentisphaerae bacterium]|nr:PTS transporter subunit EIIA [Lentisphaerota bacterium]
MPHTLMSLEEAAEFLHIDASDLRAFAVRGDIPCELQGDRLSFRRGRLKLWASQRILGLQGKPLADYHRRGKPRPRDTSPDTAIVSDLTDPEFMEPAIQGRSKAAVLRAMTAVAERTGYLYDPDDLLEGLRQREELCSTGIEGGAAVLHPRHHDPYMFEDSFLCIGRTPSAIPFGAPDGSKTDIFFLVCCQDDRIHLHVLARLCLLCHGGLLNDLRAAASGREMFDTLKTAETALLARPG